MSPESGRDRLVVCSPLRLEARAMRRGLGDRGEVRRSGYGAARAAAQADRLRHDTFGILAVGGTGAGLTPDLSPGDLVVGTQVARADSGASVSCPSARRGQRERLGSDGALAADMESGMLLDGAAGRPAVVLRAISDTPQRPLLSPWAVPGGIAALRSLRLAGPALARWAAACGPRRVLLAGPRSFCAGVERAIEVVERVLEQRGSPVYVRKQIVHNTHVVTGLERRGAIFVDELDEGRRCAARRRCAASTRSTRPARWSPRCMPRRAGSLLRATRWR